MVDDLTETLEADTTLTDVTIEKPNADDDVRQLTKLGNLLRSGQSDKGTQTGSGQDRFESGSDLSFDCVADRGGQLDVRILSNNVLLVLIQQVVKDLLVEQSDALEVIAGTWFETDDLVDQAVRLVRQICDVLLSLNFLLDVG